MPIFTISTIHPENDIPLRAKITANFNENHYEFGRGQWLVLFDGTAKELYEKLFPEPELPLPRKGVAMFGMAGYYGNASVDMWEWIANKLGTKNAQATK